MFVFIFRRLSEEARKASERRERLKQEAEEHKREAEEARRKAFEAERLRLMALEEEDRQVKLAQQVRFYNQYHRDETNQIPDFGQRI